MSGVGGYVRRAERRFVPPVPDDGVPRCRHCRARLDIGMWPHFCKEVTFGTAVTPPPLEVLRAELGNPASSPLPDGAYWIES